MTSKSLLISATTALVLASCGGSADLTTTTTGAPPPSVTVVTTSPPVTTTQTPTETTTPPTATTTTVSPTTTTTTPPTHAVVVSAGSVVGRVERIQVAESEDVTIQVTTDVADELHIHGLDLFFDLEPGVNMVTFQPEARGIFEAELEGAGLLLFELQVS